MHVAAPAALTTDTDEAPISNNTGLPSLSSERTLTVRPESVVFRTCLTSACPVLMSPIMSKIQRISPERHSSGLSRTGAERLEEIRLSTSLDTLAQNMADTGWCEPFWSGLVSAMATCPSVSGGNVIHSRSDTVKCRWSGDCSINEMILASAIGWITTARLL
jgi:hypothetical protein